MDEADEQERFTVAASAAVWREVDGETVVLDLRHAEYLGINPTGSALWAALVNGANLQDLVAVLTDRFGAPQEQARRDASAFVLSCRERGLVS